MAGTGCENSENRQKHNRGNHATVGGALPRRDLDIFIGTGRKKSHNGGNTASESNTTTENKTLNPESGKIAQTGEDKESPYHTDGEAHTAAGRHLLMEVRTNVRGNTTSMIASNSTIKSNSFAVSVLLAQDVTETVTEKSEQQTSEGDVIASTKNSTQNDNVGHFICSKHLTGKACGAHKCQKATTQGKVSKIERRVEHRFSISICQYMLRGLLTEDRRKSN